MALERGEFNFYTANLELIKNMNNIDLVIGIDQSLVCPAICVLRYEDKKLIMMKCHRSSRKGTPRLDTLSNVFQNIVDKLIKKKKRCVFFIEGYAYGRVARSHQMGELGGLIKLIVYRSKFPFLSIPPTAVKKFASGKGMVKKNMMLKEVYKRWDKDFSNDNEADAYSIAMLGVSLCREVRGEEDKLLAFQHQVAKDAANPKLKTRKRRALITEANIDED